MATKLEKKINIVFMILGNIFSIMGLVFGVILDMNLLYIISMMILFVANIYWIDPRLNKVEDTK